MIDVDIIFNTVNDLKRLDFDGYTSNSEFNRSLRLAENDLYQYYLEQIDTSWSQDALRVFEKEITLFVTNGIVSLPSDYRNRISVEAYSTTCGNTKYVAEEWIPGEAAYNQSSTIRKGDATKGRFGFEIFGNQIKIYGDTNKVALRYYRNPTYGNRAVDFTSGLPVYNQGSSTQVEWPDSQLRKLVDILLFYKGMVTNRTEIIGFLQSKKSYE